MELIIEKMDYEGRGIAHYDGKVCFVKNALPNEKVEVYVDKETPRYMECDVISVIDENPNRCDDYCKYSFHCGGCNYTMTNYPYSVSMKRKGLEELFKRNNLLRGELTLRENKNFWYYRNKVSLKVLAGSIGFYKEKSHELIEIENCYLANPQINEVIKNFSLFYFLNGSVTIRCNLEGEILLVIETNDKIVIDEELYKKLNIYGIVLNQKCIYGKPYLIENRGDLKYIVRYDAFFQVNPYISEELTSDLVRYLSHDDIVLDLYCGVGYLSLKAAKVVKEVVGIEIVKNAVISAKENAKLNNLSNVAFYLGDVGSVVSTIKKDFTKVIVDPPRAGLDKKTRNFLKENKFNTVIYVSCNPYTLIRDLKDLESVYDIKDITCYDMFSCTKHVETVAVLERR